MRALLPVLVLILTSAHALAQPVSQVPQTQHPHKVLTPEQIAYQKQMKDYDAKSAQLRADALAAYNAEIAREKAPACPDAANTVAINGCLAHENEITARNYKAVTAAVRAMLAQPQPVGPGEPAQYIGPSGPAATPATNTAAFDKAESAWQTYAAAECNAADTYWRGGTIVNAIDLECELRMSRARLHELDTFYAITHPN